MTTVDSIPAGDQPAHATAASVPVTAGEAAERIFAAALGTFELFSVYLGDRLGWYRSLATDGPATPGELAARTGTQQRYAREWLEQQAVGALLRFDPATGQYAITPGMAEVLTDEHSLDYLAPAPMFLAAVGPHLERLVEAYRDGGGVSWAELGAPAREGQARMNRPWYEHRLAAALRSDEELDRMLSRPGARILDVGCGGGWSTTALAEAYPEAQLTGVDIDEPSITMARQNAGASAVADRVGFMVGDAGDLPAGSYDAAFAFECLHDMPYPLAVLQAMRRATAPDGAVVIMDEAVADEFGAPGDDVERFLYGCSLLICLPDSLSAPNSVGTGTVMRRPLLERYARDAGFGSVTVMPIEDFSFFRFYRLHH